MLYEGEALVALAPAGERAEGGGIPRGTDEVVWDMEGEAPLAEPRCFTMRSVDVRGTEGAASRELCSESGAGDTGAEALLEGGCGCSASATPRWPALGLPLLLGLSRRSRRGLELKARCR